MPLDFVITSDRLRTHPEARDFIEFLRVEQAALMLGDAVVYYDFPAYSGYDAGTAKADILILSQSVGLVAVRLVVDGLFNGGSNVEELDQQLVDFSSNLYSRLVRSRELRMSLSKSIVDVVAVLIDLRSDRDKYPLETKSFESNICSSFENFASFVSGLEPSNLTSAQFAEARSVIEGAKALYRVQKRVVQDPAQEPLAAQMQLIENEIANFDQMQRRIALVDVGGPARIRGLAGSGKTVILAMKAAHLHLNNPTANILVTFFTKSLRATLKNLIAKFYRHYAESDPDWKVLHIRHGWGGSSSPRVYSDACRRKGTLPLNFADARRIAKDSGNAFQTACDHLLALGPLEPYYDHVLIDEGQDFPASFYQLCYAIAKGARDKKSIVWAYDELQDILNVKIRQPDELFGKDGTGEPIVSLDRTSAALPPGARNDVVLSKCYRNQRSVLVAAHALGFGVYGTPVQMLESAEHWNDVGYQVLSGPLVEGKSVEIIRPEENSPLQIADSAKFPLIASLAAESFKVEIDWIVDNVVRAIKGGLRAEEIMIICLDDRGARNYFAQISGELAGKGVATNNIIADPYNEPPFSMDGMVTLSTVYRAKGNEAAFVVVVGVDAIDRRTRSGRNKVFTAFSRSKAWLRVSGLVPAAGGLIKELETAVRNAPKILFKMPNLLEIETIQRGFTQKQVKAKAARDDFVKKLKLAGLSDDEIAEELGQGSKNDQR